MSSSDPKLPTNPSRWPVLDRLTKMQESDRRRMLRWHSEIGMDSAEEADSVGLRSQLDGELIELTLLELEAQTTDGEAREKAIAEIQGAMSLRTLATGSPGFVQFLNSYLYFGIRFALGREPHRNQQTRLQELQNARENERPVALPTPPNLEGVSPVELAQVESFRSARLSPEENLALKFLDGFTEDQTQEPGVSENRVEESLRFELWLRGLLPLQDAARFETLARGMYEWSQRRHNFYAALEQRGERAYTVAMWNEGHTEIEGEWTAKNPLASRCGVAEIYWLARMLRAEVTADGVVTYHKRSWLSYLPFLHPDRYSKDRVARFEEVLRSVLDFACEMIQNAADIARKRDEDCVEAPPSRPSTTEDWLAVYDQEIDEIADQRRERLFKKDSDTLHERHPTSHTYSREYWSERLRNGHHEENLVGVAISGGGIRSATYALGVLQALKDFDMLRYVDYLSTVSGGGYIGAWLLGNVRRSHYWLSRMTNWDESIGHLRRYSKYLAPQSGALSADTWVIWGTWIRNAFLIQLTALVWLAALFAGAIGLKLTFDAISDEWWSYEVSVGVLAIVMAAIAGGLFWQLWKPIVGERSKQGFAVALVSLAWAGSFITAAILWSGPAAAPRPFSNTLMTAWYIWHPALMGGLAVCLFLLAFCSMWEQKEPNTLGSSINKVLGSALIAMITSAVAYLAICGVAYFFDLLESWGREFAGWFVFVFGPALVLLSVTLAVMIFVGLVGRNSADWRREWWTRYGSWLSIFGIGFLAVGTAAVFGPVWVIRLIRLHWSVPSATALAAIGSVISGLYAGNSAQTKGDGTSASPVKEWIAKLGGIVFISVAVLGVSTLLHVLLTEIFLDSSRGYWRNLNEVLATSIDKLSFLGPWGAIVLSCAALLGLGVLFSWRFDINTFGLNQFYRNRLVRCYLGATRWMTGWRRPEVFTGFDDRDDLELSKLQFAAMGPDERFRGPFPIVNCSLNLGGSSDLAVKTRQSASFTLTPLYAGADRAKVGYAPVRAKDGFADDVTLGQAISISGAAASPNMGYNTSALVAVLLTMFNVRLAWWFPNPGKAKWRKDSPLFSLMYLMFEFLGIADEDSLFVNVSDGGHFENLAIYELIRRRTRVIICSDGECDPDLTFGSLGNVIRICETDFAAKIDIDVSSIHKQAETGRSLAHCAIGKITYSSGSIGYLIYLKASLTGDEDAAVQQYHSGHMDFPHQSTANQFFTEDQFESYRMLGRHIAHTALRPAADSKNMVAMASKLYNIWAPSGPSSHTFVEHSKSLDKLWARFSAAPNLAALFSELLADGPVPLRVAPVTDQEKAACLELFQLMENVFLDLRLDLFWEHPDNRGWANVFIKWARSATMRMVWNQSQSSFGIRFGYFCGERLGLPINQPEVVT